jgi:hypothetical protein
LRKCIFLILLESVRASREWVGKSAKSGLMGRM